MKITALLSSSLGGGAEHLLNVIRYCPDPAIRFSVVVPNDGGHVPEILQKQGIPVQLLDIANGFRWNVFWELVRYLKSNRPDIVHCHGYRAGLYGRLAAKLAVPKSKIILTVHGFHYIRYTNKIKRWLFLTAERCFQLITDHVVAVSDTDRNHLIEYKNAQKEKSSVIVNGIDIERFANVNVDKQQKRSELRIPAGATPVIGTVARLCPEKGVAYFIQAFPKIRAQFPSAHFLVVGDGFQKAEFQEWIYAHQLTDAVCLAGQRDDVPELMALMDVFVFPSLWEGLPLAPLEAMAMGIPVVATDVCGNRDIIEADGRYGVLVSSRDANAIAEGVARLLTRPEETNQMKTAAQKHVSASYSATRMAESTAALYVKLGLAYS